MESFQSKDIIRFWQKIRQDQQRFIHIPPAAWPIEIPARVRFFMWELMTGAIFTKEIIQKIFVLNLRQDTISVSKQVRICPICSWSVNSQRSCGKKLQKDLPHTYQNRHNSGKGQRTTEGEKENWSVQMVLREYSTCDMLKDMGGKK